ncbi:MAG: putative major capsid protein [Prokaryotic dsDNA virus sp.]|jgi:HK97 family phage major capsid protein|nr:MAG: putative major capsid protein [Prokaryotic dsDNA virus sp.]|tara:strand:- start:5930 stop:7123 length:1194 start_codon:yes stop_codon:yes gene_type:complete
MEENVKNQLDQLGNIIDEKIEKATGQALESANGKADEALKGEIDNLTKQFNERFDAFEVKNKKMFEKKNESKDFKTNLTKALNEGAIDNLVKGNTSAAAFEIKADMTMGADYTGEVVPADRVPGFKFDPNRPQNMRQIIPNGSTGSDVVRFVKESGYSNGAAAANEGATLGQTDFDMTATSVNVEKIGTFLRISDEMLNDTAQLTSYISNRVPAKLLEVEDDQILGGNGVAPNLNGLYNSGTNFDTSANGAFYQSVDSANEFDVLVAAINQLALSNYKPNYILLNPTDFHKILLLKDSQSRYLKDQVYQGLQPSFMGVPVIINNEVNAGSFLVGDFNSCQLWIRENLAVSFHREDGTNIRDGFVTVRCQERIALATYLPLGIIDGTFSTAKTALETP